MPDQPSQPPSRLRDLPRAHGAMLAPVEPGIWNRRDRPLIVSMLSWICAGTGYVAFFLKGGQLPMYFMDMKWLNPQWKPMQLTPGQFTANVSILLAEMLLALAAIAGGLGSLKMREWGRRLMIYYAIAAIVLGLLKTGYQIQTFDAQINFRISTTTESVDRDALANREFFYLITTAVMGLVWPLLVIGVMTRPHIKRAFRMRPTRAAIAELSGETTPTNGDDDWRSA